MGWHVPQVVRYALGFRRRDAELHAICGTLSEPEQYATGWLDDLDPDPADHEVECSEDAALLGWAAGRHDALAARGRPQGHVLRALVARCDAYRTTSVVAAAFHDHGLPRSSHDLVEPPDVSLEESATLLDGYSLDVDSEYWARHLAQALMAEDREDAIDRVLVAASDRHRRERGREGGACLSRRHATRGGVCTIRVARALGPALGLLPV